MAAANWRRLGQRKGRGRDDRGRGLFLHSLQAFRLDGIPLGTAWAEVWARPQQSDATHRNEQSIDEKESGRWIRALQAAGSGLVQAAVSGSALRDAAAAQSDVAGPPAMN